MQRIKAICVAVFCAFLVSVLPKWSSFHAVMAAAPPEGRQIPVAPPPMGWSSWNSFSNTVDSNVVIQQTKAMVANGMKAAGYQYINIDEGWWLGTRDENGNITVEPKQWPALEAGERAGDMANIVKYIHNAGLKAGIYTDAGEAGCGFYGPDLGPPAPHTGSIGHYDQDFLQFSKWGFDYVKVDWCGGYKDGKGSLDPAVQYTAIAHAIERAEKISGHHLFFSLCEWGVDSPWTWAPGVGGIPGDIWRTSGDIVPPIVANTPNSTRAASFAKVLENYDLGVHPQAQHTGFYNDPDMMVVGMQGLSFEENRGHLSLWAMSGAPLLVGADLTKLDHATLALLTNPDIVAIDQDSLGVQAIKVDEPGLGLQVWTKPMPTPGEHAVMLLNRSALPADFTVSWSKIGLDPSAAATVRDVWAGKDAGSHAGSYTTTVPTYEAAILIIRGSDAKATVYDAASSANEFIGGAGAGACKTCAGGKSVQIGGEKVVTFKLAPTKGFVYVQIAYINHGRSPLMAEMGVNGDVPLNVLFPPTGEAGEVGAVTVAVDFGTAKESTLTFAAPAGAGPELESIAVLAGGR